MIARVVRQRLSSTIFRSLHQTVYRQKVVTEVVPVLGESITEGSIAQWVKKEGDRLSVDDVVLIVETDKVTVDIKAPNAGTLVKRLVEDIVFVGKPLYEVDVDGSQVVAQKSPEQAPVAQAQQEQKPQQHTGRKPSIKFLGKRKPVPVNLTATAVKERAAPVASAPSKAHHPSSVDFAALKGKAWFGRPQLDAKEMNAIESGGAF